MRRYFAISAIGKDRPGIVADVAELIYKTGCNMEDSSMTILGNQFALLTLLSGKGEEVVHKLASGCKRLERDKNLTILFTPIDSLEIHATQPTKGRTYRLMAEGLDKAGIVFKVCRILAQYKANIVDMKTQFLPSPETGTPIYKMDIEMVIPEKVSIEDLTTELIGVGEQLAIEIQLIKAEE
ncbi:MAG: hypothetical protein GTN81_08685 [Proteobacteria bacterium]|nr:hypothetical protein [Pseudomonadota bacterium]